jgi:catechol 2,3-dioxygenase-like lactoylglutathione lyase family enzyme
MSHFLRVTPFLYVPDLERALAFFVEVLGFAVTLRRADYAFVAREGIAFRLWERRDEPDVPRTSRRFAHYIEVRDVDALYAELKPKLDRLPAGDVHGPADKPYGQRELLVLAPDGDLVCFGQAIAKR